MLEEQKQYELDTVLEKATEVMLPPKLFDQCLRVVATDDTLRNTTAMLPLDIVERIRETQEAFAANNADSDADEPSNK